MALKTLPPAARPGRAPATEPSSGKDPCPYGECDGSGFTEEVESRTAAPCRCRPERLARLRASTLRRKLPNRYQEVSFDRPPVSDMARAQPSALREVRRYCTEVAQRIDAGRGMWLLGESATGKTTLAMLIARHAMEAHRATAIYSTVRLLDEIRSTFDDRAEQRTSDLIDRLIEVDMLILDDLAVVRPTDWVLEQLYAIINGRYEEERAIVFTCDLADRGRGEGAGGRGAADEDGAAHEPGGSRPLIDPRRLAEHIGYRTFSRLVEICGDPVVLFGPDARISR